jgi:predicted ATPase
MSRLALYLLGPPRIELDGRPVQISRRKVVALLAYLAVTGTPHSRDSLATLLWPERSQSRARAYLRRALSELNRTLGEGFLTIDRETAGLQQAQPDSGPWQLWVDVAEFRERLAADEAHSHPTTELCSDCVTVLEGAVGLYCDDFMAGFTLRDSPDFDEWQFFEREALRDKLASALERLMRWHSSQREYERAIGFARRWLALDPLHEPVHRHLMRLYDQDGQRAAALRQYLECERILQEELGISPAQATTELYEQIRTRPEEGEERPGVAKGPRHNLPAQTTPFIGREAALAEIAKLLQDPDCRLLTLVGPGGSGKTRLALEASAAQLDANGYEHGIFFVSLAPLSSVDAIVPTVADVLGFRFFGGGTPQQQLLDFLRQRNLLLIMDNYEHLLEGADLVSDITKTAPGVKVLATSRARLNVGGEHRFPVGGMDYPESSLETVLDATRYSAVELFTQSARRARPDFQLAGDNLSGVLDVCRLAEGMPLAVRLAAAWVAVLTPDEIAVEIGQNIDVLATERRDVPERQRSMRAAFDHSWSMLTQSEREVMRALSVFRGGFTRKAAQQVSGASLAELMALVDKSLVHRTTGGHFEVHELLRQYAAEKLGQTPSDREAVHDRHCAYYATALQDWGSDLKGPRQLAAVQEMDSEIENARAAWNWAVQRGDVPCLDQAMEGLFHFYEWRGRYLEGETASRVAGYTLATSKTAGALRVRAKILAWEGVFNRQMGRSDTARQLAEQSLALLGAPELADQDTRAEHAAILRDLGWVTGYSNPEEAQRLLRQSLALARALGDRREMAHVLYFLGSNMAQFSISGDYREAQEMLEESLTIFRALGDRRGIAYVLGTLSHTLFFQWQLERAERLARESVAIHREIGHLHGIATLLLTGLGWILYRRGKYAEHHSVLEEHLEICYELGLRRYTHEAYAELGLVELQLGQYKSARVHAEMSLSIARERENDEPFQVAVSLQSLGCVALVEGAYVDAQTLLQEAVDIWRDGGPRVRLGCDLAFLAIASRGLGQISQAREYLCEALCTAADIWSPMPLLPILPATSLILAGQGKPERAVEIYALASRYEYVANSRWFEDVVGKHITAAAAALPQEVVAAAQERGRARDPRETAQELLEELTNLR